MLRFRNFGARSAGRYNIDEAAIVQMRATASNRDKGKSAREKRIRMCLDGFEKLENRLWGKSEGIQWDGIANVCMKSTFEAFCISFFVKKSRDDDGLPSCDVFRLYSELDLGYRKFLLLLVRGVFSLFGGCDRNYPIRR